MGAAYRNTGGGRFMRVEMRQVHSSSKCAPVRDVGDSSQKQLFEQPEGCSAGWSVILPGSYTDLIVSLSGPSCLRGLRRGKPSEPDQSHIS